MTATPDWWRTGPAWTTDPRLVAEVAADDGIDAWLADDGQALRAWVERPGCVLEARSCPDGTWQVSAAPAGNLLAAHVVLAGPGPLAWSGTAGLPAPVPAVVAAYGEPVGGGLAVLEALRDCADRACREARWAPLAARIAQVDPQRVLWLFGDRWVARTFDGHVITVRFDGDDDGDGERAVMTVDRDASATDRVARRGRGARGSHWRAEVPLSEGFRPGADGEPADADVIGLVCALVDRLEWHREVPVLVRQAGDPPGDLVLGLRVLAHGRSWPDAAAMARTLAAASFPPGADLVADEVAEPGGWDPPGGVPVRVERDGGT